MSSDEEDFSPDRQKKRGCSRLRIEEEDEEAGASGSSTGDSAVGPLERPRKKCRTIEEDDESDSEEEEEDGDLDDSGVNVRSENEGESSDEDDEEGDDEEEREDDSDNWEDINEDAERAFSDSDASDGQSEKCAICLNKFLGQEIGIPECCDHAFCLECLLEWTKKINTCPVDRQVFQLVLVRLELDGKVIRRVPVEAPEEEVVTEENPTYCEVCARCDREDRLLLCDACDLAYHCECLDPPLETIPIEEWYCPNCTPPPSSADEEEMPEDLLDEFNELLESRFRPQTVRRAIARTRASETVRSRIQSRRTAQGSSSTAVASSNGRPKTKRKVVRKKATKRKSTKRRTTSSGKSGTTGKSKRKTTTGKKKKRKTWRRRTRRRKTKRRGLGRTRRAIQAARPLVCPTVKGRIAERLGLQKPPPGHTLPLMRQPGPPRNGYVQDTGLLLFGDRDELHSFETYEDDDRAGGAGGGGGIAALRATPAHRHAPHKSKAAARVDILDRTSSVPYPSFDLLGSILQTQTMLHTNNVKVKIGRDGSLMPSSSDKTPLQCPLAPPGSAASDGPHLSDRTHAKSYQQASASDANYHATETENCSTNAVSRVEGGDAETVFSHSNDSDHCSPSNDEHKRPHRSPQSNKQHHAGKETKSGTSDEDIDIYSDIESISNDTAEDMYGGDETMGTDSLHCDPGSPADQPTMADSSEDELVIDEEAAHPESEQEEAAKNGLATPEEDDEENMDEIEDVQEADASAIESPDPKNEDDLDVNLSAMKIEQEPPDDEDDCEEDGSTPVKDELEDSDEQNMTPVKDELDDSDEQNLVRDTATPVVDEDFENESDQAKSDWEKPRIETNLSNTPPPTEIEPKECSVNVKSELPIDDLDPAVLKSEREPSDEEVPEATVAPVAAPHAPDEDDVICAKVGSPISESEEQNDHSAAEAKAQKPSPSEDIPKEAEEEEEEERIEPVQADADLPEDGEIPTEEACEDQPDAEDAEEETAPLCFSKLEGVEDVSEAGSEDNRMDEDEKEEEDEGEEEDGVAEPQEEEGDVEDDVEAKVAQLFSEDSKPQQSEEEEGLCESGNSQEPQEVVQPVQKTHHYHHHSIEEQPRSRSRRSKDHSSDNKRCDTNSEVSWKKLSKSTKERSYRDGKPRDDRVLYRERELKDKSGDERERTRSKRDDGGGGCRHSRSKDDDRNSRHDKRSSSKSGNKYKEKSSGSGGSKYEKRGGHRNERTETSSYDWRYDKYEESKRSSSDGRHRDNKTQSSSSSKYKHKDFKYDQYGSKYEVESDKHYKYEQQSVTMQVMEDVPEKQHRRDRDKHKDREVRKVENKLIVEKKSSRDKKKSSGGSNSQQKKRKRTPSPISDVSDIESKEIYSKGGSIIINVNYNRSTTKEGKQQHNNTSSERDSNKHSARANNGEDDSWAAATAGGGDSKSSDDIQILCEKPVERTRPSTPPRARKKVVTTEPVKSKTKKKNQPDPSFDMFWRDVEDISQDKIEEREEMRVQKEEEATPSREKESMPPAKKSPVETPDKATSDTLTFSGIFKKQPRSPSPPSPSDNESYDPCDPTRSPSPKPEATKEAVRESKKELVRDTKPKPPPEPILPPLPPEPEPRQPSPPPPSKNSLESPVAMSNAFANTPSSQFSNTVVVPNSPMSMPNIRIPPPNFLPQPLPRNPGTLVASGIQTLRWPMANGPPPMIFQASQMQHLIRGNFMAAQLAQGGLQPPQLAGMMPPHGASHLAMLRPPLGGPGLLPNPASASGGPLQPMLLPDLSHPPPPLVMQTQLPFSGVSVSVNSNTVNSVPLMVPLLTSQPVLSKTETVKEGSDLVVDMEVESPYSPADSPPADDDGGSPEPVEKRPSTPPKEKDRFDALLAAVPRLLADKRTRELLTVLRPRATKVPKAMLEKKGAATKADLRTKHRHGKPVGKRKGIAVKMRESQLKILDELPSSAVEMQVKEKFLKKLNRQERVVEEVKHALKPFYNKRDIDKLEYKTILRKCVPKICHNKTGEINPVKIKGMVEGYVRKYKHHRKKSQKGDS